MKRMTEPERLTLDALIAKEESGWLIESASPQGVPQYWDGRRNNSFTIDASEAVRFARFEDAERVRAWTLLEAIRCHCRSVQHLWTNPGASALRADAGGPPACLQCCGDVDVKTGRCVECGSDYADQVQADAEIGLPMDAGGPPEPEKK